MGIPIGVHDVAYWQLDEASATDAAVDLVGGYHLTSAAAAAPVTDAAVLAIARRKRGRTFGGTACLGRASAAGDAAKLVGDLTVSAWIKPTTAYAWGAIGYIATFGGGAAAEASNRLFLLYLSTTGVVTLYWEGAAHVSVSKSDVGAVTVGRWTHVAATRSQDTAGNWTARFYRNGALTNTASVTTLAPSGGTATECKWGIGRSPWTNFGPFLGDVDEVRVWKRALSADEIAAEYNASCYLRLDGINLDRYVGLTDFARIDSALFPNDARRRSFDGGMREDLQTTKMRWKGRTVPLASSDVTAIRSLIEGLGDVVTGSELWSTQGSPVTGTTVSIVAGKYGNALSVGIGDIALVDMTWLTGTSGSWSVVWWESTDSGVTWVHRIKTSTGLYWENGATSAGPFGNVLVSGGVLNLYDGSYYDDVVVVPYAIPSDWVEDVYNEHSVRAWTAFPSLRASGDWIPEGARTVRGSDLGSSSLLHIRSGAAQVGGARLDFSLEDA